MTDTFVDTPAEPGGRLQLLAAILLGLAATMTALSAYQAALLDGEALQGYSVSNSQLSDANYFYNQGNQTLASDQQLFVQYATATQQEDADLSEYLKTLMRPELSEAIDWWTSSEEAVTPFDEDAANPYVVNDFAEAEALDKKSKATFKEASAADDQGDQFELAAVLFALTLFFGGIATLFARRSVSLGLLGIATLALVTGAVQLAMAFAA
ncbi:hypothetical protein [Nocardioides daeguensis]|uniref:DUF4337 domain-containing protein n=1 Tax=Nocardioides daeguensis TaxID=908359 RepID=A0ABP6VG90_9ACTN|nr:hypothetical protein [Nocardioides daeguensis]MBV6729506.1 hypothetical protein [Nocardioides daeguensis]MCR1771721.1 hypothetical protein [Nocardioides daeguensis]